MVCQCGKFLLCHWHKFFGSLCQLAQMPKRGMMDDSSESMKSDEERLPVVPKNFWDSEIDEESIDSDISEINDDERDLVCDETDSNE
uniref:Uncharacterized protein n=1 Tax=Romanomermis culicivorax TaxID=13658 RepID=A0A915IL34_ROMCU